MKKILFVISILTSLTIALSVMGTEPNLTVDHTFAESDLSSKGSIATTTTSSEDYITFSINTQDFAYPEQSIATLEKIISLHEQYQVPVDIYLTSTMVDLYAAQAPDLLERLKTSPIVAVSYHIRPPKPYYQKYDWMNLAQMTPDQQYEIIHEYETHGLNLATGEPTENPGGYQGLADFLGYSPYVASALPDQPLSASVYGVFEDLGATFTLIHGRAVNLGETRNGLYLKPEHVDLKLFEHVGQDIATVIESALTEAHSSTNGHTPNFVGVKMHDNDFFAESSAWTTVYLQHGRKPPWDTSYKAGLLSEEDQDEIWALYESAVIYVDSIRDRVTPINAATIKELVTGEQTSSTTSSTLQTDQDTLLYISGTMHIENNRQTWPDPEALIDFFERVTSLGMRWSVGPDIDWLRSEPRAGEIILATEAMGVEWDVHTHAMEDRAEAAAKIIELGGQPTDVASGLLVAELDQLSQQLTASNGSSWQAEVLWGISGLSGSAGHAPGNDDESIGLWRPASSADYTTHDPEGVLIAVGSGTVINLSDIETLVEAIDAGGEYPSVLSISLMIQPATLLTPKSGEGLIEIEAWFYRLTEYPFVRWATIAETAEAWKDAGGIPSRMENWP